MYRYIYIYIYILIYIGCNKKIEPVKYLGKYTLDRKVKKIRILCLLKSYEDTKIDGLRG